MAEALNTENCTFRNCTSSWRTSVLAQGIIPFHKRADLRGSAGFLNGKPGADIQIIIWLTPALRFMLGGGAVRGDDKTILSTGLAYTF
ncbi:MAG: hypothetical protein ACT4OY_08155 [Alphaproteobacteria bacterium]